MHWLTRGAMECEWRIDALTNWVVYSFNDSSTSSLIHPPAYPSRLSRNIFSLLSLLFTLTHDWPNPGHNQHGQWPQHQPPRLTSRRSSPAASGREWSLRGRGHDTALTTQQRKPVEILRSRFADARKGEKHHPDLVKDKDCHFVALEGKSGAGGTRVEPKRRPPPAQPPSTKKSDRI